MQWSTDIRQIKAAIFDQAFIGRTWVSCPMGRVVAIRRRKGQLLVAIDNDLWVGTLVPGGACAHRCCFFTSLDATLPFGVPL